MRMTKATIPGVKGYAPLKVQLSGDATDERMKTRTKVESRKRQEASKSISIDVFNVQSSNGEPWDIDVRHYVEIPPENIFDEFVVDELEYTVDADGKLKTTLTLVPVSNESGSGGNSAPARTDAKARGDARRSTFGVDYDGGQYPDRWEISDVKFA